MIVMRKLAGIELWSDSIWSYKSTIREAELENLSYILHSDFNASDYLLVPLIPTTLSVRTYKQLLVFLKSNGYDLSKVYAFFSMVDMQSRLHHDFAIEMYS